MKRMKHLSHVSFWMCLFSILSCVQSENSLRGSIRDLYALDFQSVQIELIGGEGISIAYVSPISGSSDFEEAAKILIDNSQLSIEANVPIDLVQSSVLSRFRLVQGSSGLEEDRQPFPAMHTATLTFTEFSYQSNSPIAGYFSISFINGDTLLGDFRANLSIAN
ncbi:MAG: hypothetical protein KDD48_01890 [Bdellovibrionales bacterium]|nr:hypothetical protein [Bdellovibrionales bacterium]